MNKRTISIPLVLTLAILIGVPGALAIPDYYGVLQSIYGGPTTCQLDCHTSPDGPPPFTAYGTAFDNQLNHGDVAGGGTKAALIANGPPLATVTVTPANVSLPVGGNQTFTAATLDSFGNNIIANVTWMSSDTTVGTIGSTTGVFTAVGAGTTTITATGGGTGSGPITGNATVTVSAITPTSTPAPTLTPVVVPVLTTITVSPSTATLNVNGTQNFTATALDQNSTPMAGVNITWMVSDSTIGNISALNTVTGMDGNATTTFMALAVGNATVNAMNGTVSGNATVNVTNVTTNVTVPTPKLTLTLNNTMDGTSPPLLSNITSAVLLDTSGNNIANATLPDNMTAQFNLSGISPGDYFIEVNGLAGDHLPTRIDSNTSDINQTVGLRLRNSVIGDISNPNYRIKVYPSGHPPVVNSSHPVVNYATGANESTFGYVIVNDSIKKLEVRVLDTAQLLSNFTPTTDPHPAGANFSSEPFNIWILGDVTNPTTGAFIGNHGHLFNASNDMCSGCHGNVSVKLPNYSDITPPFTPTGAGWCFKCHNGPSGPRNGFIDPTVIAAANGTIAGNVTNASNGSAISGATVTANGMMATTDANGSYSINLTAGTYNVTASATGFQTNTTTSVVVTPGNMTIQDFALIPTAVPPSNATFNISGFKINDTNGNGVWDPGETGIGNWNITLSNSTGTLIDHQATDSTGFYQFMNVSPGTYNVTEEMKAGFNSTNATSMPVTVENMDVMNVNFTNQPVAPTATPTVTATVTTTATPTPTVTPTAQNLLIQNAQQQIQNAGQLIQIAGQLIQIALQQIQNAQQQIQIAQQIQNASSGT